MKNKLLCLSIIILILTLIGSVFIKEIGWQGYYYKTNKGFELILEGRGGIVEISKDSKERVPSNIKNGDRVWVISNGIKETYPASTELIFCIKLVQESEKEISESVFKELREYGLER